MGKIKTNNWGYIPLLLIVFCNMLTYYLFRDMCKNVCELSPMSPDTYSTLKFIISPILNLLLAGILIIGSRRYSIYSLVQGMYGITLLLTSSFLFFLVPLYAQSLQSTSGLEVTSVFMDLKIHWAHAFFYIFSSLWAPLTLLMFYGYLNNIITFDRACKIYPILAIYGMLLSEYVMPDLSASIISGPIQGRAFSIGLVSMTCFLATMSAFYAINRTAKDEPGEKTESLGWLFLLSLAILTVSVGFTKHLSIISWSFSIQLKDAFLVGYWDFLNSFTALKNLSILLAAVLLAFLSVYLRQNRMGGWKNFCYLSTAVTTLLIITLLVLNLLSNSIGSYLVPGDAGLFYKLMDSVGSTYQIFITTLLYPALLCLRQLVFVPVPLQDRFSYKVIVDLVFHKLGYFAVVFLQTKLVPISEFKTLLLLTLVVTFIIVLILRLFCINYVSKKLELAA